MEANSGGKKHDDSGEKQGGEKYGDERHGDKKHDKANRREVKGDQKSRADSPATEAIRAHVITVSDRGSRGEREDKSGPRAVDRLKDQGFDAVLSMVRDGADSVSTAIRAAIDDGAKVVITSGGTGIAPRDLTPEGTRPLITRELPGIAEMLRRDGARNNPMAVLSRGIVGVAGNTFVANLPGSVKALDEGLDVVLPLLPHILDQMGGGDH